MHVREHMVICFSVCVSVGLCRRKGNTQEAREALLGSSEPFFFFFFTNERFVLTTAGVLTAFYKSKHFARTRVGSL